ncbi:hypothetical protein QBC38DRAFT_546548 [Podospora fimiseda]|uniref:Uncharacterized protein n=1 Tax=Podospora fimiseda TaxID=252190 RepID=A0AAN7BM13_9PEZI|nr:hypothetical protein QBC38DRAFT_546548 [Podospora fimiseda]
MPPNPSKVTKYYPSPTAHKHDLRKNEYYTLTEFYSRVKAWYKAEIDRYSQNSPSITTNTDHDALLNNSTDHDPGPDPPFPPPKRRIQPSRSSKRLAPQTTDTTVAVKRKTKPSITSIGDYILPLRQYYNYETFTSKKDDEAALPQGREYEKLPGTAVAYFLLAVEDSVKRKIDDLPKIGSKEGIKKCVSELKKYKFGERFESASTLEEEGKGWKPSDQKTVENEANIGRKRKEKDDVPDGTAICRLGSPAPIAEMIVSPTLGRWGPGLLDASGGVKKRRRRGAGTEDLEEKVVDALESLGLKFAVDLCRVGLPWKVEEGARVLML